MKFHLIPFYTFKNMLDKHFIAKIRKASNAVNTGDRVTVLALCHSPYAVYQCIKFL